MFMSVLLGLEGDNHNLPHVLTLHISRRKQHPTKAHRGNGGSARILYPHSTEVCGKLLSDSHWKRSLMGKGSRGSPNVINYAQK
jgi:hypothetical protein